MRGRVSVIAFTGLIGLVFGLAPVEPAVATGAGNVEFDVGGRLPEFPCEDGCFTTFDGTGTGAGELTFEVGSVTYNATFTILAGTVSGSADYTEPGLPFCPLVGSASSATTGSVTLSGGATGVVFRTSPLIPGGTVFEASTTLDFSYQRVGATTAILITGGSVTAYYFIPGSGTGSVTKSLVAGAGSGVFVVNPTEAAARCLEPGPLDFDIIGDALVATD